MKFFSGFFNKKNFNLAEPEISVNGEMFQNRDMKEHKLPEISNYIKNSGKNLQGNELLLETIFEDAPVPMILINSFNELIKINKAGKQIGLNNNLNFIGLKTGNAFNCINLPSQGCGESKECTSCRLCTTIYQTFQTRTNQSKVPILLMVKSQLAEKPYNFLLSTSYLEIDNLPLVLMVMEDVTTIVQAEKALIESEFRYKQITRAITDYIYTVIIHSSGEVQTVHTSACIKITGYQAEEFERDSSLWMSIVYKDDTEAVSSFLKKINSAGEKNKIEYRIVRKDGTVCWISNTLVIKALRKDKALQYDGVIRDITERKQAEEALENQNKLFNTLLNNLPIGIFMVSATDGKPLVSNKHAQNLLGKGLVQGTDISYLNTMYNAYIAGTDQLYPSEKMPLIMGLQGKESHSDDMEIEYEDGTRVLLEIVGSPVYDKDNCITASLVGFYDITPRKNSEIALRESERKLSIIFEYSQIGISLSDAKGNIQYMNPAFCKLLGYHPEQAIGENISIFTDTKDEVSGLNLYEVLRNLTGSIDFEKKYIRNNGQEIWVQMKVSCYRNMKGEVTNFIVMAEDISERKKSIDLIKASEENFRNIFNTSNDSILIIDFEGYILKANKITADRTGINIDELAKGNILEIIDFDNKYELQASLKNMETHPEIFQTSYNKAEGEKVYIEIVGHTINYNNNKAILLISRDITERMVMQQKILNAIIEAEEKERNFFSQELHDGIGPILSTIKLYLQWIQSPDTKSNKAELLDDALRTIEEAIISVKEISNKLSPNVLKKFGLETAIQSFVRKIGNVAKVQFTVNIRMSYRIKPEIETMLYRVFVEAINNSLKYAEATHINIELFMENQLLHAIFRDNGKGFEVSKALETASGNGLFNMQNRVQTYEGFFTLKSHPGQGTEIKIILPGNKIFNFQLT